MFALKIEDIKAWLIENTNEHQKQKAQEFPPFDNAMYSLYGHLHDFLEYYKFKVQCDVALNELNFITVTDFAELSKWTKKYEILGSQDLLMFEINYIRWDEQVSDDIIKIHEGLFTERKPFVNILCFCKVFQHLYWENCIHEVEANESEQTEIIAELQNILKTNYRDTTQE